MNTEKFVFSAIIVSIIIMVTAGLYNDNRRESIRNDSIPVVYERKEPFKKILINHPRSITVIYNNGGTQLIKSEMNNEVHFSNEIPESYFQEVYIENRKEDFREFSRLVIYIKDDKCVSGGEYLERVGKNAYATYKPALY